MTDTHLAQGLKVRHLTMMGLGSAIGAGLFVGSGNSIAAAGPGVLVSYALAGVVVVIVMSLLGELASARPSSGAFSTYAEQAIGPWAGYAVGWSYWFMLIMVLGVEILAATSIMATWVAIPQWIIAGVLVAIFAAVNLVGVRQFGELEFWFAAIKVAAIIAFLVVGVLLVTGVLQGTTNAGFDQILSAEGGFFPTGAAGVAAGLLAVMFAFGGIEIITIAAAEAKDPQTSIRRATISIMWRILFFYIGSVLVMLMVLPWNDPALPQGSFVAVLNTANIPYAAGLMEVVIVVALLSAFNAQIYATSRMAYSLAGRGEGPKRLLSLSSRGVPWVAVMVSIFFSVVAVTAHAIDGQGRVMGSLLDAVGAFLLIIWVMIAISQIRLRPHLEAEGSLRLRTWAHPWLGILAIVAISAFCVVMLFDPTGRQNLLFAVVMFALICLTYGLRLRLRGRRSLQ
ncbi:amino acid permease [Jonesia quinghaiensis]|uniref:amino acid permease n=1 Tax=Jonesia quinghaiensis TaxID=262806 RepID=UPI0004105CD2|nr:amino acid permease [Jonesia quinghaiensis]